MRGGLEGLAVGRAGPRRLDIMLTCGEGKLEGGPARRGVRPAPAPFPPPIRLPPSSPSLLTLPTLTRGELCMGHKLECTCAAVRACARGESKLRARRFGSGWALPRVAPRASPERRPALLQCRLEAVHLLSSCSAGS